MRLTVPVIEKKEKQTRSNETRIIIMTKKRKNMKECNERREGLRKKIRSKARRINTTKIRWKLREGKKRSNENKGGKRNEKNECRERNLGRKGMRRMNVGRRRNENINGKGMGMGKGEKRMR